MAALFWPLESGEPAPASRCGAHSAFPVLPLLSPAEEMAAAHDCLHLEQADVWIGQYSLIPSENASGMVPAISYGFV